MNLGTTALSSNILNIGNASSTINIKAPLLPQYAYNTTTGITPTTGIGYINIVSRGGSVNFTTIQAVLGLTIPVAGVYLINVNIFIQNMNAFPYSVPTIISGLGFGTSTDTTASITSHHSIDNNFGASGSGSALMTVMYSTVETLSPVASPNNILYATISQSSTGSILIGANLRCNVGSYLTAVRIA